MASVYLKPLRDYDPHDQLSDYFTLAQASGNAGSFVELVGSGLVMTADHETVSLSSQNGVYSNYYANPNKVTLAAISANKSTVVGMMINNVRDNDYLNRLLRYDTTRAVEANAVPSGQTIKLLTRGLVWVSGISGSPGPNSGVIAGLGVAGVPDGGWQTVYTYTSGSCGRVIGSTDGNGYVPVIISL